MFMHKLALRMGRTVAELSVMTTDELARWMAYDRQYPIGNGFREMDALFAHLCFRMAQFLGVKKQFGGAFSFDEFQICKPREVRTPQQFMRSMFGSRVKKRK
jgi:hypothetical protein